MAKVTMEDVDIINIAQLAARANIANSTGEKMDTIEKQIVMRMSNEALNWYIQNLVPVVGRPKMKEKWMAIRKSR